MHYGPDTMLPKSATADTMLPKSATAAGAEIVMEPTDMDFGARNYAARDPEGHLWGFGTYWPRDRSE